MSNPNKPQICPTCKRSGYKPEAEKAFLVKIRHQNMNPIRYHALRHQQAAFMFVQDWDASHSNQIISGQSTIELQVWVVGKSESPQFFSAQAVATQSQSIYAVQPI